MIFQTKHVRSLQSHESKNNIAIIYFRGENKKKIVETIF